MLAAVVRPITDPRYLKIVPAPKKPIPVTTPAAILAGSQTATPLCKLKICMDVNMIRQEPTETRMWVRKPSALPWASLSKPINPPKIAAKNNFNAISA
jgi:hypothetical protein